MINSVAVISKGGQLLLVRQFTHQKHSHIEGHLAAFPQLVAKSGHNYIDTENVRLVYQEVNDLYIVIAVSKDENIIEALDTVSLFVDVTRSICGEIVEEKIVPYAIDLILAYDECVFDGYTRNINASDVNRFLKMESAEEQRFLREREEKELKQKEILAQRASAAKNGQPMSSGPSYASSGQTSFATQGYDMPMSDSFDNLPPQRSTPSAPRAGGMVLGRGARTAKNRVRAVMAEEGLAVQEEAEEPVKKPLETNGIQISLIEKLKARLSREGTPEEIACEGRVMCNTGKKVAVNIHVTTESEKGKLLLRPFLQASRQKFRETNTLVYDTENGQMELGQDACILGWKKDKPTEDDLPFSITNWVTPSGKSSTFSCDVQLKNEDFSFDNLVIQIPIENPRSVNVSSIVGDYECVTDREHGETFLKWSISQLDKDNDSAEIEFTVDLVDEDSFYPINVSFDTPSNICGIDIDSVTPIEGDEDVKYTITRSCYASDFKIE